MIVAANHISFFDTVVLMLSVPRRTVLHRQGGVHGLVDDQPAVPRARPDPDRARAARKADGGARRSPPACSRDGHVLGIYPEGTRSRDGLLHKGHTGVAQLALMTGAPDRARSGSSAPIGSSRSGRRCRGRSGVARSASGQPLDPAAYGGSAAPAPPAAHRRPDGGDPPAVRAPDVGRLRQRRAAADPRRHGERVRGARTCGASAPPGTRRRGSPSPRRRAAIRRRAGSARCAACLRRRARRRRALRRRPGDVGEVSDP